jgi:hypothetical protein
MPNYWLFRVMFDWYPDSWKKMVDAHVAAQQYPPRWTNEVRNIKLQQCIHHRIE